MRLGVYMTGLDSSQACILTVEAVNNHLAANPLDDVVLFVSQHGTCPLRHEFAILQEQEMWLWPDPVVATDFFSAKKLAAAPGPSKKMLYLWDLEWAFQARSFSDNASVYLNKNLDLVTASQDHADVVSTLWRDCLIVEDFDVRKLART